MLYLERTVTINRGITSIDEPVILYKGDKNVEIQFYIKNNPFRVKSTKSDPTYGQLVIQRTNAESIFSEVAQVSSGKVLFVITAEMIDELPELGSYTFQIRLFNDDKSSRGTLPEIVDGIIIKKPICDGEEPAAVNRSQSNDSYTTRSTIAEETFDDNGNYNSTVWRSGDLISDVKLNKVEDAISNINVKANNAADKTYIDNKMIDVDRNLAEETTRAEEAELNLQNQLDKEINRAEKAEANLQADIDNKAFRDELPTHVSQLENDAKYLVGSDVEKYISEDELNDKIGDIGHHSSVADKIGDLGDEWDKEKTVTNYINDKIGDIGHHSSVRDKIGDLGDYNDTGKTVTDYINDRINESGGGISEEQLKQEFLRKEVCSEHKRLSLDTNENRYYKFDNREGLFDIEVPNVKDSERTLEHHIFIQTYDKESWLTFDGEMGNDIYWQGGILPELEPNTLHEIIMVWIPYTCWYGGCIKYKQPEGK